MPYNPEDQFFQWKRNVIDEFKPLSEEEISSKLSERTNNFAVLMTHVIGDFNIGSVLRSSNFHGAKEFFYWGKKRFDRRSSVGVHHYTPVNFLDSIDSIASLKSRYSLVGLENNVPGTVSIYDFTWPTVLPPCIIVGEENVGIHPDVLSMCDHLIEIPNHGSVRSINVSSAASIAMHDYVCKLKRS